MSESKSKELPCFSGPCKYLGWCGLTMFCRHPAHVAPIYPTRAFSILAAAGKCKGWLDWEMKVMPNSTQVWPDPVDLKEVFQ